MNCKELTSIVLEASKLMLTDTFEISQKDGYSNIVTSSDLAVQQFLMQRLSEALPGCGFLCEESDSWDLQHTDVWIIDPIDGTANYSRGIHECGISVGLQRDGVMEMAVVYVPRTGELFSAQRGQGAYLNGKPLRVSTRPFANSILCTALPVYHKEYAPQCGQIILETFLRCNDVRRFGAAAPELCYLAMGRCELYFEYLLSPWDFAAASLIVQEAGGMLTDLDGNPLCCTRPSGVVAANNPANHAQFLDIVKQYK